MAMRNGAEAELPRRRDYIPQRPREPATIQSRMGVNPCYALVKIRLLLRPARSPTGLRHGAILRMGRAADRRGLSACARGCGGHLSFRLGRKNGGGGGS